MTSDKYTIKDAVDQAEDLLEGGAWAQAPRAQSDAAALYTLAVARCEFFHDADGRGYAQFERGGHRETALISSAGFGEWLCQEYYREHGRIASDQASTTAIARLNGHAKYSGPEREAYLRHAFVEGAYWIDLCDSEWRAVRVNRSGWTIVDRPPVPFIRTPAMRPLPVPKKRGSLKPLWQCLNIPEPVRNLFLACMLECFRPETPHLVIEFVGQKGTSKSTTQDFARSLIDPNKSNNRTPTRTTEDLVAVASSSYVVSLENVSQLSDEQQDDLCRLTTGAGFARRKLYTDFEEGVVSLKRPVFLNGISANVTAADLLDRTVSFELSVPANRRTSGDLKKSFESSAGSIFGGILDLFVASLVKLDGVKVATDLPRMADFGCWGEAVYRAQGLPAGAFLKDFEANRRASSLRVIESSPVVTAIRSFLERRGGQYEGTVGDLLAGLDDLRPKHGHAWPRSAKGLSDILRKSADPLLQTGVSLEFLGRSNAGSRICLELKVPRE